MKPIQVDPLSALIGAAVLGLALVLTSMGQQPTDLSTLPPAQGIRPPPPELKDLLSHISIVYLDDGQGGKAKTVRFSGVNVQIVNGLEATNGHPADPSSIDSGLTTTNGLGNLIIGYNEANGQSERTGSHNLVVGTGQDYTSFGGALAGADNAIRAPYASALAGQLNTVSGAWSSVAGGFQNMAQGTHSAINGGQLNQVGAQVRFGAILGGVFNRVLYYSAGANGEGSTISGGSSNLVNGASYSIIAGGSGNSCEYRSCSAILGGGDNTVRASNAAIVGGASNVISENTGSGFDGEGSVIVGGSQNRAEGWNTVVVGGTSNYIDRYASASVIDGGRANSILGSTATNCVVGGGFDRLANSTDDWRAGGLYQDQ